MSGAALPIGILGCETLSVPAYPDGRKLVARFVVKVGPILMSGCHLFSFPDGTFSLGFPGRNRHCRTVITDRDLRRAALAAAVRTFQSLALAEPAASPLATAPGMEHSPP